MSSNKFLNLQHEAASVSVEQSAALPPKDEASICEVVQPAAPLPTAPPQSSDAAVVAPAEGAFDSDEEDDEEEPEPEPEPAEDSVGDEEVPEGEEADEEGWVGEHNLQEALARCASGDLSNAPSQCGSDAERPTVACLTSDFAMQVAIVYTLNTHLFWTDMKVLCI